MIYEREAVKTNTNSLLLRTVHQPHFLCSFGAVLFKPDAVEGCVVEELSAYIAQRLYGENVGSIHTVHFLNVHSESVTLIYPDLPSDAIPGVTSFLTEGTSILTTFIGNGSRDITAYLNRLKGRQMLEWTTEELNTGKGLKDSLRGVILRPGTRIDYQPVINKIIQKKSDRRLRFTDDEYGIYIRNLVHVPDSSEEMYGLLSALSEDELEETLTLYQQKMGIDLN